MSPRSAAFLLFPLLLTACGRKVDGVLYARDGGSPLSDREIVAVPAGGKTRDALEKFCADARARGARADSLRAALEARSAQLSMEAAREQDRNGWSQRWRQLRSSADATADSARAVPYEALASASPVAQELAVARATTNAKGEFHLASVPYGKHFLVATADDDWGNAIAVGLLRPTRAELSIESALPGCSFLYEISR